MSELTVEPWRVGWTNSDEGKLWGVRAGNRILTGPNSGYLDEADAHLIGAAPDLLAACEAAFVAMGGLDFNDRAAAAWRQLEDAIRKARGRGDDE